MAVATFTRDEILRQLDECAEDFVFPMLDNGYVYPADVRLTAFRDEARWAIVIEAIGFHYRAGGHDGMQNALHKYGNCLERAPGTDNDEFLCLTQDGREGEAFDPEYMEKVHDAARTIRVRDRLVDIPRDSAAYASKGIRLREAPTILAYELLRVLLPEHRDLLLATDDELRRFIPHDLPIFLQLDAWHHPDLANDELVSASETFRSLADALVAGDPSVYAPSRAPNTHWSNWPEGGTL